MIRRWQVVVALLVGIWAGALLVAGFNPLTALLRTFDTYFVGAFTGEGNAEVLLFTFLLGGTIGLVQKSGGALGLANALKKFMGKRLEDMTDYIVVGHHKRRGCIVRYLGRASLFDDAIVVAVYLCCDT